MSRELKVGDHVRVTARDRTHGYQPGDTGTVLRVSALITTESPYYTVAMDRDDPDHTDIFFGEGEIKPDV